MSFSETKRGDRDASQYHPNHSHVERRTRRPTSGFLPARSVKAAHNSFWQGYIPHIYPPHGHKCILTGIVRLFHVFDPNLMTQILISPCKTCSVSEGLYGTLYKKSHLRVWMLKFWQKLHGEAFKMPLCSDIMVKITLNDPDALWFNPDLIE